MLIRLCTHNRGETGTSKKLSISQKYGFGTEQEFSSGNWKELECSKSVYSLAYIAKLLQKNNPN